MMRRRITRLTIGRTEWVHVCTIVAARFQICPDTCEERTGRGLCAGYAWACASHADNGSSEAAGRAPSLFARRLEKAEDHNGRSYKKEESGPLEFAERSKS